MTEVKVEEKIIRSDFEYIRSQILEVEQYLSSANAEIDLARIMLDDIIQHTEAFIKEDL